MKFSVKRFAVPDRKPRNRYPLDKIKAVGDGFTIKKEYRPKGRLSAIGWHRGMVFSQKTLSNGDLRLVLVGWTPVVKRKPV
jgi:hypothetical protein